ncbi:DNA-binding protein [Streptomyces sp. NPDC001876]|uniref:DNA-binding protein n=1 Tax=Streptomyces sp. NPDC001876 TaxID=3154402 RepID=UPI00332DC18F
MTSDRNTPPDDFPHGVGNPARNALHAAGYTALDQLPAISEAELLRLHGVGPKAVGVLRAALEAKGLSFAGE